jgi:hypothetical protein
MGGREEMVKTLHIIQLQSLGQPLIGELIKNHEQPAIKAPLGLGQAPGAGNVPQIVLFNPTGNPDVLYFTWAMVVYWYEVKDQGLINLYIQSTSGITLALSIPPGRG